MSFWSHGDVDDNNARRDVGLLQHVVNITRYHRRFVAMVLRYSRPSTRQEWEKRDMYYLENGFETNENRDDWDNFSGICLDCVVESAAEYGETTSDMVRGRMNRIFYSAESVMRSRYARERRSGRINF